MAAGVASVFVNVLIVVTGGLVRLTGSGLGCPTWPRCTPDSLTPHGSLSIHQAIEFGNRMLTPVLTLVALATIAVAMLYKRRGLLRLALLLLLGVAAQAVIGGITVRTGLNPWIVSSHLVISMAMISTAVLFCWRVDHSPAPPRGGPATLLARATYVVAAAVLAVGTLVTGAGPHAGDAHTARNGLDPLETSQFHADLVFLLVGLSLALLVLTRSRAAGVLVGVELAQGVVGYVQYFTGLPVWLVAVHMLGAGLLMVAVTWSLLDTYAGALAAPAD